MLAALVSLALAIVEEGVKPEGVQEGHGVEGPPIQVDPEANAIDLTGPVLVIYGDDEFLGKLKSRKG